MLQYLESGTVCSDDKQTSIASYGGHLGILGCIAGGTTITLFIIHKLK